MNNTRLMQLMQCGAWMSFNRCSNQIVHTTLPTHPAVADALRLAIAQLGHSLELSEGHELPILHGDESSAIDRATSSSANERRSGCLLPCTWNSSRSSSTHVTNVVTPGVMPATIPVNGASPALQAALNSLQS